MLALDLMVDIDDVIFPTIASIHDLAQKAGLHDGTARMAWSGWESYTLPSGEPCPPDVYWDLWSDFALGNGYVDTEPIPFAVDALRYLKDEGCEIHLVTARGFMNHAEDIRRWTPEWLKKFDVPHSTLTFSQDKVAAMYELGVKFDSAIDDSPRNVKALLDAGVNAYLQDHPHNTDAGLPESRRVKHLWRWAYKLTMLYTPVKENYA